MLKKLNGLVLAALLVANAPVMAASNEDAALAQVAAQVKALVVEGEKAGLSKEDVATLVYKAVEEEALPGIASLTAKQKKYVRYVAYGILAAVGIYGLYRVYGWYTTKPADQAAEKKAAKDPAAEKKVAKDPAVEKKAAAKDLAVQSRANRADARAKRAEALNAAAIPAADAVKPEADAAAPKADAAPKAKRTRKAAGK